MPTRRETVNNRNQETPPIAIRFFSGATVPTLSLFLLTYSKKKEGYKLLRNPRALDPFETVGSNDISKIDITASCIGTSNKRFLREMARLILHLYALHTVPRPQTENYLGISHSGNSLTGPACCTALSIIKLPSPITTSR